MKPANNDTASAYSMLCYIRTYFPGIKNILIPDFLNHPATDYTNIGLALAPMQAIEKSYSNVKFKLIGKETAADGTECIRLILSGEEIDSLAANMNLIL